MSLFPDSQIKYNWESYIEIYTQLEELSLLESIGPGDKALPILTSFFLWTKVQLSEYKYVPFP